MVGVSSGLCDWCCEIEEAKFIGLYNWRLTALNFTTKTMSSTAAQCPRSVRELKPKLAKMGQ